MRFGCIKFMLYSIQGLITDHFSGAGRAVGAMCVCEDSKF